MPEGILLLSVALLMLALGAVLGYFARQTLAKNQLSTAEGKAAKILDEAEKKAKEEIVSAKKKALDILSDAEKKIQEKEEKVLDLENRLLKKEEGLEKKQEVLEKERKNLLEKAQQVKELEQEAYHLRQQQLQKLEEVAGLRQEEAREQLFRKVEEGERQALAQRIVKLEKEGKEELEKRANNIMVQVIQRYARSHASEIMTSSVSLPSDDIKGKIIGKEGRNIRVLERLTGVEVLIDDTPEMVILSSFDPVRREIAKIALEELVADGRINPARIEEVVEKAQKEIQKRIKEAGEAAAYEVGVLDLDSKLLQILGTLRYRTSFKQNVLLHSLEVAFIAGTLAAELGFNVKVAKKAGLLHDIGKAIDHKVEGTHVNIGIKILEKFGVEEEVILAMRSHHEEYPYALPEAFIVTAADAISASRPGARKDTVEHYIKRLEDLETLVGSFEEVEKSFAIQAGREIRVFVNPHEVSDEEMVLLARTIADRIQEELSYPGEIKVNVMRETRAIEIAR